MDGKIIDAILELGRKGYRAGDEPEVCRFTKRPWHSVMDRERDIEACVVKPADAPILMTQDGTLWHPAAMADRYLTQLRAIAEAAGLGFLDDPTSGYTEIIEKLRKAEENGES